MSLTKIQQNYVPIAPKVVFNKGTILENVNVRVDMTRMFTPKQYYKWWNDIFGNLARVTQNVFAKKFSNVLFWLLHLKIIGKNDQVTKLTFIAFFRMIQPFGCSTQKLKEIKKLQKYIEQQNGTLELCCHPYNFDMLVRFDKPIASNTFFINAGTRGYTIRRMTKMGKYDAMEFLVPSFDLVKLYKNHLANPPNKI